MSPLWKTRHRLRNRCHHSLTHLNTGAHTGAIQPQHHSTSPPLQDTVPRSPPSPASAIHSPPQHLTCPCNTTHNTGTHIGAFPSSTACEMKSEDNYGNVLVLLPNLLILWWMKKIGYPSNPHSLIRLNPYNWTFQCSSIRAR